MNKSCFLCDDYIGKYESYVKCKFCLQYIHYTDCFIPYLYRNKSKYNECPNCQFILIDYTENENSNKLEHYITNFKNVLSSLIRFKRTNNIKNNKLLKIYKDL